MKIFLIILAFLFGFYICLNYSHKTVKEYFQNNNQQSCPNILIQKGNVLWLYNKNKETIPGINPIIFEKLADYTKYVEWQQQQNINCPVLYFQEIETAEGDKKLRHFPDYLNKNAGLKNFNTLYYSKNGNDYIPAIRKTSDFKPTLKLYNENAERTENAMDTNWLGASKSRKKIQKAKFASSYANQLNMKNLSNKNDDFLKQQQKFDNMMTGEITQEELLANHVTERNNFDFNHSLS